MSFTKNDEQNPLLPRVTDADEPLLVGAVVWIVEFCGMRICPDGLCLFEPNAMLLKIRGVLDLIPVKSHFGECML